jgi:succinate dehydrogenase/fumarate reductase cytochrome b subunit
MKALEFILGSFWHWAGFMAILVVMLYFGCNTILHLVNRFLRHSTLKKIGYPPVYCDGDGDFRDDYEGD